MRVTLVVCTLGRTAGPDALLASAAADGWDDLEIVLVDQNPPGFLDRVTARHAARLRLVVHRPGFRGLSRARNAGIRLATGEVVGFPDDDAVLPPRTLERAVALLADTGADMVAGRCLDAEGRESVCRFSPSAGFLRPGRWDGRFIETASFAPATVLREFPFDERLGAGAFHGAEEGADLVVRLLAAGRRVYYDPSLTVVHPQTVAGRSSPAERRRALTMRRGFARLCRKHGLWGRFLLRTAAVAGALPALAVVRPRSVRFYLAELAGLLSGVAAPGRRPGRGPHAISRSETE